MIADADGGIMKKKVDLKIHPCNMQDVDIFNALGSYKSKINIFYCLDRDQELSFVGDWTFDTQTIMIFDFQRCNQTELRKVPGYKNNTYYSKEKQREILN